MSRPDSTIVADVLDGDRKAFRELVERYQDQMIASAHHLVGDRRPLARRLTPPRPQARVQGEAWCGTSPPASSSGVHFPHLGGFGAPDNG